MQRTFTALTALIAGITYADMDIQINITKIPDEDEMDDWTPNYEPEPYSAINNAIVTFCDWFVNDEEHGYNLMCDINQN